MQGLDANNEGIIGLALDDPSNGPCYVNALYNAGMISQRIFGVILGTIDNFRSKSSITFGGYDDTMFKD
jgi:hypothetical protein